MENFLQIIYLKKMGALFYNHEQRNLFLYIFAENLKLWSAIVSYSGKYGIFI
jgi:hypothetical protein